MSQTGQLFVAGVLAGWVVLNVYGQWYWTRGKGVLKKHKR